MSSTRSILRYCALLVAVGLSAPVATAQPGALDPTFGGGGIVLIDSASVCAVTTRADGWVVALGARGGGAGDGDASCWGVPTLWRFHAGGSPDVAFGKHGSAPLVPYIEGVESYRSTALGVLPSGTVVALGHTYVREPPARGGVWRVRPDGSPVATNHPFQRPVDIAVRPDGRYVIVGGDEGWAVETCEAVQFRPDGTPDPTFGDDGFVDLTLGEHANEDTWCTGGGLLGDGRLVVFLEHWDSDALRYWGAVRLLEDGTLDPTFGDGGIALVAMDGSLTAGAVTADGTVLLGGAGPGYPEPYYPILVRLTAGGSLDQAFGEGGVGMLEVLGEVGVRAVVSLPGGGAALTGVFYDRPRAFAARVRTDGTLDPAFGRGGVASLGSPTEGWSIEVDVEDRIVVGGGGAGFGFIARLLNDEAVENEPSVQPERLTLSAPAPNPASGRAALTYTLAEPAPVRLVVYDVLGREVAVLAESTKPAGQHEATLDASRLVPGLYVARLTAGGEAVTRRLTVVR